MSKRNLTPSAVLPAHRTKHVPLLDYPFRQSTFCLAQTDNGVSNGTALWLGAQCLSALLARVYGTGSRHTNMKHNTASHSTEGNTASHNATRRPRVIELGSGIGLSALALCSMGWDVVATDLPEVIGAVLASNIKHNLSALPPDSGTIQVRALDWTVSPDQWSWGNPTAITPVHAPSSPSPPADDASLLGPPFDLIVTADTIYSLALTAPLLRTLNALSALSVTAAARSQRGPPIYLCFERRDPMQVDQMLAEAAKTWTVKRIPHSKLCHAMEKGGLSWDKSEWEDVEVWTLTHMNS